MDFSLVITAHREGRILEPTLKSALMAAHHARISNIAVEIVIVCDTSDAPTKKVIQSYQGRIDLIKTVAHHSLSHSRNEGAMVARGEFVGFLDGDDLVSSNWISDTIAAARAQGAPPAIYHPQASLYFGAKHLIWPHPDTSTMTPEDFGMLLMRNPWSALSIHRRETILTHPFRSTYEALGLGYEDWAWNLDTIAAGYAHIPVKNVFHFLRSKPRGSMMERQKRSGVVVLPSQFFGNFIISKKRNTKVSGVFSPVFRCTRKTSVLSPSLRKALKAASKIEPLLKCKELGKHRIKMYRKMPVANITRALIILKTHVRKNKINHVVLEKFSKRIQMGGSPLPNIVRVDMFNPNYMFIVKNGHKISYIKWNCKKYEKRFEECRILLLVRLLIQGFISYIDDPSGSFSSCLGLHYPAIAKALFDSGRIIGNTHQA